MHALVTFCVAGILAAPSSGAKPQASARAAVFTGHWDAVARKDGRSWRLGIDILTSNAKSVTVDLVDVSAYGVEFNASFGANTFHLERRTASMTTVIEGTIEGGRMNGRFTGLGLEAPFTGVRSGTAPSALTEETVSFTNGVVTLAGTVLYPGSDGPYPAIVCTHGSGPGDRQFAAYRSEGVFYARLGVVALIYDRRGAGKSTGDSSTASMEDLADDALAGLELLRTKKKVNGDEIGITGVSQGGWISPLAASRSKDVAFVIVLSASGINPMDQSIFNVENVLRRAGHGDAVVAEATALRRRLYEIARGAPDPRLSDALESAHAQPWFGLSALPYPLDAQSVSPGERRFLGFEPLPVWERVTVPVLALWGGEDISVPAARSREIIEGALVRGGNRDHTLVLYPTADHGLRLVREKDAAWDFPRTVPGSRALIAEWLCEHVHGPSRMASSGP